MRNGVALAAACVLAACASTPTDRPTVAIEDEPALSAWEAALVPEDRQRLALLPATWAIARTRAEARSPALLAEAGALLAGDAALDHPALTPGSYHCSLTRLGDFGRRPAIRRFPPFFCYVRGESGDRLSFTKQTGTDLPGGWLTLDEPGRRYVFTGAQQRRAGDTSLAYGGEPARDLAGVVERIGSFRWRLVIPWRGKDAGLDVYDLVPVPTEFQAPEPPAED